MNILIFNANMYKIKRKSVYNRKYHIENILNKLSVQTSYSDREKINRIFHLIDKCIKDVNNGPK